jgi:DNA adenine methylase
MFEPAVKWSGSKRKQAEEIINRMPREIGTYYEPFCGGCSVLRRMLSSKEHHVNAFVCSDANPDLIDLWNAIRDCPVFIVHKYTQMWKELNKDNDIGRKKDYFNQVRERFNAIRSPQDFLFIMRTTTNGMPRYNKDGKLAENDELTMIETDAYSRGNIMFRKWTEQYR